MLCCQPKLCWGLLETQPIVRAIPPLRYWLCCQVLALDGVLQLSERFEANYHEMLAHLPVNLLLGPAGGAKQPGLVSNLQRNMIFRRSYSLHQS